MTAAPDSAETVAPRDPSLYAPRRGLGAGFWGMIVFGIVCVAIGVAAARFGPAWLARAPTPSTASFALPEPSALPLSAAEPPTGPVVAEAALAPTVEVARLEARIALLESGQQRSLDAAAAGLAAAALAEAAQSSRPFAEEMASLEQILPLTPDLRALARLAQDGAPTRAGLADEFERLAARAATAARDPGRNADFLTRLRHALASVVSIRRVELTQGTSSDAVLARAQRRLNEGDIDGALEALDLLPVEARSVLAAWRAAAERRVEIDRHVAAVRADALAGLAQVVRAQTLRAPPTQAPAAGVTAP
jgi:hypothetical protein